MCSTLLLLSQPVLSEDLPELVSDRPDQTESSVVLPPGFTQLEMGWTHTGNDDGGEDFRSDAIPETLIRYGLCDRLELRLGHSGYTWEETDYADDTPTYSDEGWGDSEIGMKYFIQDEVPECFLPETALLVHVSMPTGQNGFSSERYDPSFRLSLAHTLSDTLSFSYNLGMFWESEEDDTGDFDTLSNYLYTVSLSKSLSDRLGLFCELFGDIPASADGKPANSFDTGLTYLVNDNIQVDVEGGVGLSEAADDWFVGVGVVYRFPK
jgi:hypothetical protein